MPYSLLNHLSPAIIHQFYQELFQVMGVVFLVVLVVYWFSGRRPSREEGPEPGIAMPQGYSFLWKALGILWLADGILQAQPAMATSMFVDMDVATNIAHQPHWYLAIIGSGIQVWTAHQIPAAVFAVIIQLAIGGLILLSPKTGWGRAGLWISIVWSLVVWTFGEGLGNLAGGHYSWLKGDPGAALFYIAAAVMILVPQKHWRNGRIAAVTRWGFGVFWLISAAIQAWPGNFWRGAHLTNLFLANLLAPQPAAVSAPITLVAHFVRANPALWNGIFVGVMLAMALVLLVRVPRVVRLTVLGIGLLISWWIGQDFGIVGGVGTDPNAAPVVALLLVGGFWQAEESPRVVSTKGQAIRLRLFESAMGMGSIAFLLIGFILAQPQGLKTQSASTSLHSTRQRAQGSKPVALKKWMQVNQRAHAVHIILDAQSGSQGNLTFDGYANGFLTMKIPLGWHVQVTFTNQQSLVKNSAMLVPVSVIHQGGPFHPAFTGAKTPAPTVGVSAGHSQSFSFIASRAGHFGFISAVPDGQAQSGMWVGFNVAKSITKPQTVLK